MMEAMAEKDPSLIDSVVDLLTYERETWQMVIDQQAGENRDAATVSGDVTSTVPVTPTPTTEAGSTASGLVGGRLHLAG